MRLMTELVRRRSLKAVLVAVPVVGLALGLTVSSRAQSQGEDTVMPDANGFIPRATLVEVMDSMVMSSAQVLWDAVGVSVTAEGVVEMKPETEEDWQRLRWSAVTMAEATNVLLIPGRRIEPPGIVHDESDPSLRPNEIRALIDANWQAWVGHAHALDAAALEAIRAIDAHDVDRLSDVGGTIDAACESCHLQFWYPETQ